MPGLGYREMIKKKKKRKRGKKKKRRRMPLTKINFTVVKRSGSKGDREKERERGGAETSRAEKSSNYADGR